MVASLLEGTGSAVPVTAEELIALLSEDGLEASAPEPEPTPAPAPAPAPAPTRTPAPAPASTSLDRVLAALAQAAGAPLKRGEIVEATDITEAQWQEIRQSLELDARVQVTGVARGRTYRWADEAPPVAGSRRSPVCATVCLS